MIDFTLNTALAASVALLGLLAVTDAKAMDDLTIAGTYTADRVMCKLYVDQSLINTALVNAIFKQDLAPSQAKIKAAEISVSIEGNVRDSGRVAEYCASRTRR
ncbi:hypothetical protein EON76_05265 [bacterium]|nr:MAG: hypothetical protein EON76_05265 [bacterium]